MFMALRVCAPASKQTGNDNEGAKQSGNLMGSSKNTYHNTTYEILLPRAIEGVLLEDSLSSLESKPERTQHAI